MFCWNNCELTLVRNQLRLFSKSFENKLARFYVFLNTYTPPPPQACPRSGGRWWRGKHFSNNLNTVSFSNYVAIAQNRFPTYHFSAFESAAFREGRTTPTINTSFTISLAQGWPIWALPGPTTCASWVPKKECEPSCGTPHGNARF